MIFPAARFDVMTSLDVRQPGPLIDHLLKMLQGQPLACPHIDENVPLLPVLHIISEHLAGIASHLHSLGCTQNVTPGPAVILALGLEDTQDSIFCGLGKSKHLGGFSRR